MQNLPSWVEAAFFWVSSITAVMSASTLLFAKRPTRALLGLLLCMFCLSILYTLLHAYFVAIVHIVVYAGAVMVLFLFVIMLQGLGASTLPLLQRFPPAHSILTFLSAGLFVFLLIFVFLKANLNVNLPALQNAEGTIENLGRVLFSRYLLPFELISVLVLLGIFAAVSLAKNDKASS